MWTGIRITYRTTINIFYHIFNDFKIIFFHLQIAFISGSLIAGVFVSSNWGLSFIVPGNHTLYFNYFPQGVLMHVLKK